MDFENINNDKDGKYNALLKLTKEYMDKIFLSGIKLGHLSKIEIGEVFDAEQKEELDQKLLKMKMLLRWKKQKVLKSKKFKLCKTIT